MRVELHDRLGKPLNVPASRVVVYDEHDNPIVFAVQYAPDHVRTFRAGDPDFEEQLTHHGITRTVIVSRFDPKALPRP